MRNGDYEQEMKIPVATLAASRQRVVAALLLATAPAVWADLDAGTQTGMASGASRAPYLQSLARDSTLIAWITTDRGQPAVDFGTTIDCGRTVPASRDGERCVATLRGLEPGTRYYYRVRAGDRVLAAGPQYSFVTDPGPSARRFSFFVTADVGAKKGRQRFTSESILAMDPRPQLGILCGDVVYEHASHRFLRGAQTQEPRRRRQPWPSALRACACTAAAATSRHASYGRGE